MSSSAIRDPLADHLITPQNAALILIDYQPAQFATVRSMDPELLLKNIVSTVRTAKTFGLPIVHSTVNVASGQGKPTVPELAGLLEDYPPIDRTSINSRRSASRRPGACRSSRRQAAQLGLARLRAAARLGSPGDGAGSGPDRADRTPPAGMTGASPRAERFFQGRGWRY